MGSIMEDLAAHDAHDVQRERELAAMRIDLEQCGNDRNQLSMDLAGAREEIVRLVARIAELEAGQDPDPEDPDEPTATVFGASDGVWPVVGMEGIPFRGQRTFLQPNQLAGATWENLAELRNALERVEDGGTVWLSFKDDRPADARRLVDTFPTDRGLTLLLTFRHEPENDVDTKGDMTDPAKQADVARYQAAWDRLLVAVQGTHAKTATVLLGDRIAKDPHNAESAAYHVEGVDYVGVDRYNPGLGEAKSYANPRLVLAPCVQYAAERGLDLVIGEWGTIAVGSNAAGAGGDQAGRRAWAAAYVAEVKRINADPTLPNIPVCLYWNAKRMAFNTDPTGELAPIALDL